MSKKTLIIAIILIAVAGLFLAVRYFSESEITENKDEIIRNNTENNKEIMDSFVQCLTEADMIIYGSKYCPACAALVDRLGGYDIVSSIYVECSEERDKCMEEMKTDYVPEIQIKGEIYTGPRDLNSMGGAVGCEI